MKFYKKVYKKENNHFKMKKISLFIHLKMDKKEINKNIYKAILYEDYSLFKYNVKKLEKENNHEFIEERNKLILEILLRDNIRFFNTLFKKTYGYLGYSEEILTFIFVNENSYILKKIILSSDNSYLFYSYIFRFIKDKNFLYIDNNKYVKFFMECLYNTQIYKCIKSKFYGINILINDDKDQEILKKIRNNILDLERDMILKVLRVLDKNNYSCPLIMCNEMLREIEIFKK